MKKRGFLLITACIMAVSMLAGCGNGSGQEESQSQANTTAETENESTTATTEEGSTEAGSETQTDGDGTQGKTLVVYFSATGNTERVAEVIAETTGGELFELEPVEPYTDEDLDWTNDDSRVSREHEDESLQNVELVADTVDDWSGVERIYLGYPLWWSRAAWPVNTFVEANDFTGKTVIPFCTSSSSGLGDSGEVLAELAGTGDWQEGMRFSSGVSDEDVVAWVESLEQ